MALQGTLETFALPDVLRLLDTTKNSGCLVLTADSLTGSIYLADGAIVGARSTRVPDHRSVLEVVFDLLRFTEGSFSFDENGQADEPGDPLPVDETLVEAQAMLEEWREIEKVVPSLDHWVTLSVDLPSHEVVVTAARWRTIAAVGGGRSVRGIADSLDLGEVDVSRTVKELVEAGLAVMGEDVGARTVSDRLSSLAEAQSRPSNGSEPPAAVETVVEPVPAPEVAVEPESATGFDPSELEQSMSSNGDNVVQLDSRSAEPTGDPLADAGFSADEAFLADVFPGLAGKSGESAGEPEPEPAAGHATFETPAVPDLPEVTDDELSRQLANLSPKAAAAVQAASEASTEAERDAALDEVVEDDEDINRGLLLKFLGSVNN